MFFEKLIYASFSKPLTPALSSFGAKSLVHQCKGLLEFTPSRYLFIFVCLIIFHLEQETA